MASSVVVAVALFLHGAMHVLVALSRAGVVETHDVPQHTTVRVRRSEVGSLAGQLLAVGFLLAGAGFLLVASAIAAGSSWWRAVLPFVAAGSLVVSLLDWPRTRRGAVVDAVILFGVLAAARL